MLETSDSKIKLKTCIIFTSVILVMTLLLVGFSFLAKKNYNYKLKNQVETVMHNHRPLEFPDKYRVADQMDVKSSIAVSSNMYSVVNSSNKVVRYVLITRVTTFYGPQAAVFLYDKVQGVTFEGFCSVNERLSSQFENPNNDLIIKYWKNQALKIFKSSVEELGGQNE